jgi:hypothetical protein
MPYSVFKLRQSEGAVANERFQKNFPEYFSEVNFPENLLSLVDLRISFADFLWV